MRDFAGMMARHVERLQQREHAHPPREVFQAYVDANTRFPQSLIDVAMPIYVLRSCLDSGVHPDDLLTTQLNEEQLEELVQYMRKSHKAYNVATQSTTTQADIHNRLQGLWSHAIGTTSQYLRDITTHKPFGDKPKDGGYDQLRASTEYKQLISDIIHPFIAQMFEVLQSEEVQLQAKQYREALRDGTSLDAERKIIVAISGLLQNKMNAAIQHLDTTSFLYPPYMREILKETKPK